MSKILIDIFFNDRYAESKLRKIKNVLRYLSLQYKMILLSNFQA